MTIDVHTHKFELLKVFPQRWLDGFFWLQRITFGDEYTEKLNTGKSFVAKKGQCIRINAESIVERVLFNLDN